MNIFFDTEFTGLDENAELISIGMISESGEKFYAELSDFDKNKCSDWVRKNVVDKLRLRPFPDNMFLAMLPYGGQEEKKTSYIRGDKHHVAEALKSWLVEFFIDGDYENIQLVGDVCHYDMVLLCNLFGGALNFPDFINPVAYDICPDIMRSLRYEDYKKYYVCNANEMQDAFDYPREELCNDICGKIPGDESSKHFALYDAEVIKLIYDCLRKETEHENNN